MFKAILHLIISIEFSQFGQHSFAIPISIFRNKNKIFSRTMRNRIKYILSSTCSKLKQNILKINKKYENLNHKNHKINNV